MRLWLLAVAILSLLISRNAKSDGIPAPSAAAAAVIQTYPAKGVVQSVNQDGRQIVVRHDAISNYMDAMTMPFKVIETAALANLHPGDEITFQLHVSATASWIDQIKKTGTTLPPPNQKPADYSPLPAVTAVTTNPLLFYKFTNELGQAVSLNDFHGQALVITFFYTRCPLPDYCPRLSKNFQEASQKLSAMTNATANWHFLSITFDPAVDTPAMLKAYGDSYNYDPNHWSFLTGPPDKIAELARGAGVSYEPDDGTINHNFRTLMVDAGGHLQMIFPTSGDLSDQIVAEMLKAAAVTNQPR